jgi:hypothetical protein
VERDVAHSIISIPFPSLLFLQLQYGFKSSASSVPRRLPTAASPDVHVIYIDNSKTRGLRRDDGGKYDLGRRKANEIKRMWQCKCLLDLCAYVKQGMILHQISAGAKPYTNIAKRSTTAM